MENRLAFYLSKTKKSRIRFEQVNRPKAYTGEFFFSTYSGPYIFVTKVGRGGEGRGHRTVTASSSQVMCPCCQLPLPSFALLYSYQRERLKSVLLVHSCLKKIFHNRHDIYFVRPEFVYKGIFWLIFLILQGHLLTSLPKNSICVMSRYTKHSDTCKSGGPKWPCIL